MTRFYSLLILAIVFATDVMAQNIPSYVPTNGLVGWWPFNGNANDESGNGNHGTVNGATLTSDKNGELNKAYKFDGVDDFIYIPTNSSINLETSYTLSSWFNANLWFNTNISDRSIISKSIPTGGGGYELIIGGNNGDIAHVGTNSNGSFVQGASGFSMNNWYFITATFDGNTIKLYMNGTLIKTELKPGRMNINSESLKFGARAGGGIYNQWFSGIIDDIAIYNRALTQQEITALYNSCTPPTAAITPKSTTNIKENESVILAATQGNGYSYKWYKDGTIIPNAIDSNYTATAPGNYTVKISTSQSCDSTSAAVTVKRIYTLPTYLPKNGLVGWWPFNGNANDESGNGNHGTVDQLTTIYFYRPI
jgi:Concanavalin A-like lectin/glucanases superfamily